MNATRYTGALHFYHHANIGLFAPLCAQNSGAVGRAKITCTLLSYKITYFHL
jgi:hypothetical protein